MFVTKVILSFLGVIGAGVVGAAVFWWGVVRPLAHLLRKLQMRDRTVSLLLVGSSIAGFCLLALVDADDKEVAITVLVSILGLAIAMSLAMLCNALEVPKHTDA